MPGSKVKIGPWVSGISLKVAPDYIGDEHLREIVNFDVDDDGVLIPRRAFRRYSVPAGANLLGSVTPTTGNQMFKYAVLKQGNNIYYTNTPDSALQTATYTIPDDICKIVPYNFKFYYVPNAGAGGLGTGYRTVDFTGATTVIANMPFGNDAFMFKNRMFVVSDNRIWYSKATDPTVFTAPDGGFFDITPGDGDAITSAIVQNNNIIIFKNRSTYVFTFTSDPAVDGALRIISTDQGSVATVIFNNELYTVNERSVFKFVNLYYQDIGQVLNLQYSSTTSGNQTTLHIVDQTLILTLANGKGFAMNLINGSWSRYQFDFSFANVRPSAELSDGSELYKLFEVGYVVRRRRDATFTMDSGIVAGVLRNVRPYYKFLTKTYVQFQLGRYVIGDEAEYKKMFWWSLEGSDPANAGLPIMNVEEQPVVILPGAVRNRVVTKACRFRRLSIGYESPSAVTILPITTSVGPSFRRATLYMSPKAVISE